MGNIKPHKQAFYNAKELEYIVNKYLNNNPYKAIQKLEEYLLKYPNDYSAHSYYIYALIIIGDFETAEDQLNNLENLIGGENYCSNTPKYLVEAKFRYMSNKIKLLLRQEKYEELFKYYLKCFDEVTSTFENFGALKVLIMFYCRKKLNLVDDELSEDAPYLLKQINNYNEEMFIEHMQKHLYNGIREKEQVQGIFNDEFPLKAVVEEIRKSIPHDGDNRLYFNYYESVYVFKYNNCGKVNDESTNYFRVVCFQNTNQIITMYPAVDCENLPCIDLNYLDKGYSSPYTKALAPPSRIDRFNKRFGLK